MEIFADGCKKLGNLINLSKPHPAALNHPKIICGALTVTLISTFTNIGEGYAVS
jgi:hypothetical protein